MLAIVLCVLTLTAVGVPALLVWWAAQPAATLDADGMQRMTVHIRERYIPTAFLARAGVPLHLEFVRDESDPCSSEIFLPDFHVTRRLPVSRPVTVKLPAPSPGDYLVTCRYGRYIGTIRVRSARAVALRDRLRALPPRRHSGSGAAG